MATLKESLQGKLSASELALVPSSFDIVGDLAIFSDFPKLPAGKEKLIGEALLQLHRNIKVVLKKVGKYAGEFRTPRLKIIAGEKRKETAHIEHGCRFLLNPEKAYFSARLSNERKRIAEQVKEGESILAMFSGIGVYPIIIAKHKAPKEIFSVEINPAAVTYQQENLMLNKIKNILLIKGDVRKVLPSIKKKFDRILMPLPKGGVDFLGLALSKAKKGTVIHFYDFFSEKETLRPEEKVKDACKKAKKKCRILDVVRCGQFGPGIFRVCVDFKITA